MLFRLCSPALTVWGLCSESRRWVTGARQFRHSQAAASAPTVEGEAAGCGGKGPGRRRSEASRRLRDRVVGPCPAPEAAPWDLLSPRSPRVTTSPSFSNQRLGVCLHTPWRDLFSFREEDSPLFRLQLPLASTLPLRALLCESVTRPRAGAWGSAVSRTGDLLPALDSRLFWMHGGVNLDPHFCTQTLALISEAPLWAWPLRPHSKGTPFIWSS